FMLDDVGESARAAQEALDTNDEGFARAVLVADAYLHSDEGPVDALIVEAVRYGMAPWTVKMAVPYRPKTDSSDFALYRPKFLDITGGDDNDFDALADAFFHGVDSHEHAAPVWTAHFVD